MNEKQIAAFLSGVVRNPDVIKLISKMSFIPSEEKIEKVKTLARDLEKLASEKFFSSFLHLAAIMKIDIIVDDDLYEMGGYYRNTSKNITLKNIDNPSVIIHELTHAIVHKFNNYHSSDVNSLLLAVHKVKGKLSDDEVKSALSAKWLTTLASELKVTPEDLYAEIKLIESDYLDPLKALVQEKLTFLFLSEEKIQTAYIQEKLALTATSISHNGYSENQYSTELIAFFVEALVEFQKEGISISQIIDALSENSTITEIPSSIFIFPKYTLDDFRTEAANLLKVVKFITGHFGECVEQLIDEYYDEILDTSIAEIAEELATSVVSELNDVSHKVLEPVVQVVVGVDSGLLDVVAFD